MLVQPPLGSGDPLFEGRRLALLSLPGIRGGGYFSIMSLSAQLIADLAHGTAYSFSEWPNPAVPVFGAGVYTIWHHDGRFIYVGMSGRGITLETARRNTPQGIYTRLQATPEDEGAATNSAFTWPTGSCCPLSGFGRQRRLAAADYVRR
jgi:hypothetical protein